MGWMRFSITVWSYLEFIGQSNDPWPTYSLLASLCGEAFSPVNYTVPASGIRNLLRALGFEHEVYSIREGDSDFVGYASMKDLIVNHISTKRLPALMCNDNARSLGSRGIVIGYENSGDRMIYWGCFPFLNGGSEEPIHIPVENWYARNTTLTLIGERTAFPEPEALYSAGVRLALDYLYDGTQLRNRDFYDEWKRALAQTPREMMEEIKAARGQPRVWSLYESFFDEEDMADPEDRMPLEIIDPLWCDLALRRFCASNFMEQAKHHLPQAAGSIESAQAALRKIHDRMTEYPLKTGWTPELDVEGIDGEKFADPQVRKKMTAIVEQCCREEQQAVESLQKAVAFL